MLRITVFFNYSNSSWIPFHRSIYNIWKTIFQKFCYTISRPPVFIFKVSMVTRWYVDKGAKDDVWKGKVEESIKDGYDKMQKDTF